MEKKKVELLAPAGDFSCFMAAVNAGADAVYLGVPNSAQEHMPIILRMVKLSRLLKSRIFLIKKYILQ